MLQDDWKSFKLSDVARLVKKLSKYQAITIVGGQISANEKLILDWQQKMEKFKDAEYPEYYAMVIALLRIKTNRERFGPIEIFKAADEAFVLLGIVKKAIPYKDGEILEFIQKHRHHETFKKLITVGLWLTSVASTIVLPNAIANAPLLFTTLGLGALAATRFKAFIFGGLNATIITTIMQIVGKTPIANLIPLPQILASILVSILLGCIAYLGYLVKDTYFRVREYNESLLKKQT